jgi:hypothetical protein
VCEKQGWEFKVGVSKSGKGLSKWIGNLVWQWMKFGRKFSESG